MIEFGDADLPTSGCGWNALAAEGEVHTRSYLFVGCLLTSTPEEWTASAQTTDNLIKCRILQKKRTDSAPYLSTCYLEFVSNHSMLRCLPL